MCVLECFIWRRRRCRVINDCPGPWHSSQFTLFCSSYDAMLLFGCYMQCMVVSSYFISGKASVKRPRKDVQPFISIILQPCDFRHSPHFNKSGRITLPSLCAANWEFLEWDQSNKCDKMRWNGDCVEVPQWIVWFNDLVLLSIFLSSTTVSIHHTSSAVKRKFH